MTKQKKTTGGRRKGAGRPKGAKTRPRTVATYQELGDAPTDQLEAMEWAFRAQAVSLREIMVSSTSPEKRRSEMRTASRTMNALFSKARLAQALRQLKGEEEKIASKVDPAVEAAPAAAPRPVSPIRPVAPPQVEPVPTKKNAG